MKNIFLLLSLLTSLTFYGQNSSHQKQLVLEGYVFDDTCFYEKQGDKCLGREGTEYTDKIKNKDLLKVLDTAKLSRGVYVKFEAVRVSKPHDEEPCICSTKLLVNEILEVDANRTLSGDIFREGTIKSYGKREYVKLNGFLVNQFEGKMYYEKRGDTLFRPMWFEFTEELRDNDSLANIVMMPHGLYGIRVKLEGIKYSEGPFNYGHLTGVPKKLDITKVIDVDTTQSLHDFNIEKYRERGYFATPYGDTLKVFEDFKVGKTYKFKGTEYIEQKELDSILARGEVRANKEYSVKIKAIDEITIEITVIQLDEKSKTKTMTLISGFDKFNPEEEIETIYESEEIYLSYSNPAYDLSIYKKRDENGKMSGHLFISGEDFPWRMDIQEQ